MSKHINLSGLKTLLEPLVHLINKKAERPDWNENDPSSPDYIENRPFYEAVESNTLLAFTADSTSGIPAGENAYIGYVWCNQSIDSIPFPFDVNNTALYDGEEYIVEYKNKIYKLVADSLDFNGDTCIWIGNGSMFNSVVGSSYEDNGLDFFIIYLSNGNIGQLWLNNLCTVQMSISRSLKVIHKIDEKYLPNLIGIKGTGEGAEIFNDYQYSIASGIYSHAEGAETQAQGDISHTEGLYTVAYGACSHAEGEGTSANSGVSHAEGKNTQAHGYASHAEGEETLAQGSSSHAEGRDTEAIGDCSHAEGRETVAYGTYSHAEGQTTNASGSRGSHAEGRNTTASGESSHAEGIKAKAQGKGSHAEGESTASEQYTHAEGYQTTASGPRAHSEGEYTIASGLASHAEGSGTRASSLGSHAQGKYNIEGVLAHIVGNGTSDTARSNAHTLDWQGNAWYSGDVYVGSTSGTNKDEGSKKLATESYVNESLVAITSERITEICGIAPMLTLSVDENGDALMNVGWPDENGNIQI